MLFLRMNNAVSCLTNKQCLLGSRARDMLHGYLSARRKKVNKFFWEELLPIVKSFYLSLWNQERPKVRCSQHVCVDIVSFFSGVVSTGTVSEIYSGLGICGRGKKLYMYMDRHIDFRCISGTTFQNNAGLQLLIDFPRPE